MPEQMTTELKRSALNAPQKVPIQVFGQLCTEKFGIIKATKQNLPFGNRPNSKARLGQQQKMKVLARELPSNQSGPKHDKSTVRSR
jgi:hypothetical protein